MLGKRGGRAQRPIRAGRAVVSEWLILHGGALGDLALTLHFALRLPGVEAASTLTIVSRVDPGDLSACRPSIRRVSPEGMGLHWLHADGDGPPPERLRELVVGRRVLNVLSDAESSVHRRLTSLGARAVFSFDSRPDAQSGAHITMQWQRRLEAQGLLIPKCIHQHRGGVHLLVPDELRDVRAVPEGRLKVAQGASPGTVDHPKAGSPGGATERTTTLLHPGSGGRAKCWPLTCFVDVARRLRESGEHLCFVVGPVELDRWALEDLMRIRNESRLIESPSPNELLGLLAGGRVLIGNDAGPAQLAALLGTPTVTIFGTTSPSVWRPLGPHARHIKGNPASNPDNWGIDPARVAAIAKPTSV
jgi:hypothetical protein